MDVNETLKDAGSEPDPIRKSKRKPVKKDFEDFEMELSKKSRLVNEGNVNSVSEFNRKEDEAIEIENTFSVDSSQDENLTLNIEGRIVELDKFKSLGSSEPDNNNCTNETRRLSVKELLEIVEPKISINELTNIVVGTRGFSTSSLKKTPNTKRFRNEWLKMSEFKDWLQPHSLPDKAVCTVCNKVLNAGKSELEKHGATRKHYNQLEQMRGISVGVLENTRLSSSNNSVQSSNISTVARKIISEMSDDSMPTLQLATAETPQAVEIVLASGDEENEEYDYELEESEGKHYSNHSFTQPSKEKEKETVSQSKAVVSKLAPFWKASAIVNGHVTELKLSDYKGKYVVLIFYPQDFSRVCQSELLSVSDRISEFRALNADVVACSVDSYLAHQVWCRTPRGDGGLANPKIALLSDPTHSISKDYGCFMPELGHTLRAYYIIDYRGIIRNITINDIAVGRGTDELLRLVEAFQQTDETEACCPADWKSGQPLYS